MKTLFQAKGPITSEGVINICKFEEIQEQVEIATVPLHIPKQPPWKH